MCGRLQPTARGSPAKKPLFRAFFLSGRCVGQRKRRSARLRCTLDVRLVARAIWGAILAIPIGLSAALLLSLRVVLRLLSLLRLDRGHDAEVVLGVLKVALGHDPVALCVRIAGKLKVLLVDIGRRAANFHLRSGGVERPVRIEIIAATAAAIVMTAAATATCVLRPAAAST